MTEVRRSSARAGIAAHVLGAVLCALLIPAVSQAHGPVPHSQTDPLPPQTREQLRQTREATKQFRDVEAAKAAGYKRVSKCEDDPKYGAMGFHYGNEELLADGKLDIRRPEILVYQPTRNGELRLGAVEYFQADGDQDLATDPDRPSLFGMPFDGPMLGHNEAMPIHYDMHVWLYKHNPAGLFAMWNPNVRCPEGAGEAH